MSMISAPPGYGEDYGTLSRLYTSYGLHDDEHHSRRRSPSVDTEFRGRHVMIFGFLPRISLCLSVNDSLTNRLFSIID